VPIWVFAGEKSPILHYPRDMVKALKAAGSGVKFTVLKGAPTKCWAQVYESQATWDWLFSQRRQPRVPPATQPGAPARPKPVIIYRDREGTKEYRPGDPNR